LFSPFAIYITTTAKSNDHKMPGAPYRYDWGSILIPQREKKENKMPGMI